MRAVALTDRVVAAYTDILSVLGPRDEPGHGRRLRGALSARNPPLAIAEIAAEITRLAADAGSDACGARPRRSDDGSGTGRGRGSRRDPIELNLAGAAGDPRRFGVHELAEGARADLDRGLKT